MSNGLSLIIFGILCLVGVVFYFYNKKQNGETTSTQKSDSNSKQSSSKDDIKKDDVFKFMEFDKIQDDMIIQNKGQKFTMAIKCKGINYDLMSEVEQMAVEEGFITFLNTLRYPIQLYVQAQNVDLKGAINTYKENVSSIKAEFEERDLEYTKVAEAFESTQEEIDEVEKKREEVLNVYEYANDIISYVERLSANKSLLQRSFYVLLSYYTSEINATEKFSKDEINNICYTELFTRCQATISALASCSVEGKILNSNELADLLYTAYNRDDRGLMNVKEAIESGFYRLYSTSNSAFEKRANLIRKEIEDNAKKKAYQAIVDTIKDGTYESPMMEALKTEEDTSRIANEIIRKENIPTNVKEAAQKRVVDEYRETKKQVLEAVNEEKKVLYNEATKALGIKPDERFQSKIDNTSNNTQATTSNQNSVANNTVTNTQNNVLNSVVSSQQRNEVNTQVRTTISSDNNIGINRTVQQNLQTVENIQKETDVSSSENDSIV